MLGFVVGMGVSLWFLWYGVKAGIMERRMLGNRYSERYITGRLLYGVVRSSPSLALSGWSLRP